jgi:hypothetical protein
VEGPRRKQKVTADSKLVKEEKHRNMRQYENGNRALGTRVYDIPRAFFSSRWRRGNFCIASGRVRKGARTTTITRVGLGNLMTVSMG